MLLSLHLLVVLADVHQVVVLVVVQTVQLSGINPLTQMIYHSVEKICIGNMKIYIKSPLRFMTSNEILK